MRVAVFGDINLDVTVGVDTLPGPGEEVFASTSRLGLGGSAVNTAVSIARLGLTTLILGQVGDDAFGTFALEELTGTGIDTTRVLIAPGETTGLNLITVTGDGERAMIGVRGANANYRHGPDWIAECDWLHLSGYSLLADPQRRAARAALAAARERGVPVSVDVPAGVASRVGPSLTNDLAESRLVSTSLAELTVIAEGQDPLGSMLALGVERVAITAGADGCRLVDGVESATLTPPTVTPVDATGAGDSFVAGLVRADLAGLKLGPSLALATALGAAAVTHRGAGTALGDRRRAIALLRQDDWPDAPLEWLDTARGLLE